MADQERPALEKEEARMPDGRRLIYYWFRGAAPRPRPPKGPQEPPAPAPPRSA